VRVGAGENQKQLRAEIPAGGGHRPRSSTTTPTPPKGWGKRKPSYGFEETGVEKPPLSRFGAGSRMAMFRRRLRGQEYPHEWGYSGAGFGGRRLQRRRLAAGAGAEGAARGTRAEPGSGPHAQTGDSPAGSRPPSQPPPPASSPLPRPQTGPTETGGNFSCPDMAQRRKWGHYGEESPASIWGQRLAAMSGTSRTVACSVSGSGSERQSPLPGSAFGCS
jgi:hypothetical protein